MIYQVQAPNDSRVETDTEIYLDECHEKAEAHLSKSAPELRTAAVGKSVLAKVAERNNKKRNKQRSLSRNAERQKKFAYRFGNQQD